MQDTRIARVFDFPQRLDLRLKKGVTTPHESWVESNLARVRHGALFVNKPPALEKDILRLKRAPNPQQQRALRCLPA
jgi:hypothetical protein